MDNSYLLFIFAFAIIGQCLSYLLSNRRRQHLGSFPSFRYGTVPGLRSWTGAIRFMRDPANFVTAGYELHKHNKGPSSCFRLSNLFDEYVVICDIQKIRECYAAPQKVLNAFERNKKSIQIKWVMGKEMHDNPFPIRVIESKATTLITKELKAAQEEVEATLNEMSGASGEWNTVTVWTLSAFAVARVSSVIFGGEELSRNIPYITLVSTFGRAFITSIQILRLCPSWSKGIFRPFMPCYIREVQARKLLGPYLQQRLEGFSPSSNRHNDLLEALIARAPSNKRDVPHLVQSLFAVNAAVQNTTTFLVANALFMLTRDPSKYVPELRAEAQRHLDTQQVDKSSLDRLEKLDSFLRECARYSNTFLLTAERLVMEDFTFSDGTIVPKGTILAVPQIAVHRDPENYPDPFNFDPARSSRILHNMSRSEEKWKGPGMRLTDTNSSTYLPFGHGRHSCPGRQFASMAAKLILANILIRYDIQRLPNMAPAETANYFGVFNKPDVDYQIMMKRLDNNL